MTDAIITRIARQVGVPELFDVLARRIPPTDLQSLLLAVYRRRAAAVRPVDLLRSHQQGRFTTPSSVDPALLARLTLLAWEHLPPGTEPIELSPLAPLGCVSALSSVSQDSVVGALRSLEVVADPTNVMALECARRRRERLARDARDASTVALASSQRVVRGQRFQGRGHSQHFHLLSLCSAGRDAGGARFELECLRAHVDHYLTLIRRVGELGLSAGVQRLLLTDFDGGFGGGLEREVIAPLGEAFPGLAVELAPQRQRGRGYYFPLCFELQVDNADGETFSLADGGSVPWTQRLLNNRKERCFISGLGAELLCNVFRASPEE